MRPFICLFMLVMAACGQRSVPKPGESSQAVDPGAASIVSVRAPVDDRVLPFRLSAPDSLTLYLENCNGAFSWGLERQVAGVWKPAWIVATNACLSPPIVVAPGMFRDFSEAVTLDAGESLQADIYRIAVHGLYSTYSLEDRAANEEVPYDLRVSESFAFGPLDAP